MRAINLLPKEDTRRQKSGPPPALVLGGVLGAVVVTALLCGAFLLTSGKASEKQRLLKQKQDELSSIPTPPPAQTQTQDALAADKKARIEALNSALSRRVAWDRVLREVALVLPDDVWLSKLTAKAPISPSTPPAAVPAPTSGGPIPVSSQVKVEGFTYSQAAVARLLARLSVVPDLENVQLQQSGRVKKPGPVIYQFTINGNVRGGATSATPAPATGSGS